MLQDATRKFFAREFVPHREEWTQAGIVARDTWDKAGRAGLLCAEIPTEYGGGGGTYLHETVVAEEQLRAGLSGWATKYTVKLSPLTCGAMATKINANVGCQKWLPARWWGLFQ